MNADTPPGPQHLAATASIDATHPDVLRFARAHALGDTPRERAVSLYRAVRDSVRYDPYRIDLSETGMSASNALRQGHGWCVPKAVLLAAVFCFFVYDSLGSALFTTMIAVGLAARPRDDDAAEVAEARP